MSKQDHGKTVGAPIGSGLVYGAGIAGVQAALDLANSGIKVYLVDKDISIGGKMTRLDKTFPTNDCATCILSPKLVETGRHPNVEIITKAELDSAEGEAGHFKVRINKAPRYVLEDRCTGCGDCATVCPVFVKNDFEQGLSMRRAIFRHTPQAAPNAYAIDKRGMSPCRTGCPAGVNVQGFIALMAQGKFEEALALYKQRNPFPATMGRICHHPCELACNRGKIDEPLASRALHRFLADLEMGGQIRGPESVMKPTDGKKKNGQNVAVVGSGPAGLTAAWDLVQMGHSPTVFEALPVTGGMMRVGIPRYRLPEEVLQHEIDAIEKAGVEIRTNTPIGPDLTLNDLLTQGYKAIFIAIGKHKSRRLNIEGEDLLGVIHGMSFLQGVKAGQPPEIAGKTVVIIGGGNTALDAARTSLRLGAKRVLIVYRRSREEMPAREEEIAACQEEGVEFLYLSAPRRILGQKGMVTGLECIRMELGRPDGSGRPRPIPIEGSEFVIDTHVVIPAISQEADFSFLTDVKGLEVIKGGILPAEGIELEGVRGFTDFLRAASLGEKVELREPVIIIGGGNVAIDVARTAVRMGVRQVHLVCLEQRHEMPAFKEEVEAAEEEGVLIRSGLGPKKITGDNGHVAGVEFIECVSVFDSQGQFRPRFREGTESVLPAQTVIVAIGQLVDWSLLRAADGLIETKAGTIEVDPVTFATNVPGIFAGGDVVNLGEGEVALAAIRHGHEAAVSIDRFFRGEDLRAGREVKPKIQLADLPKGMVEGKPRVKRPLLGVETRIQGFQEVELGYTAEQATAEAKRCLNCGICSECMECVKACGLKAIDHNMMAQSIDLEVGAIVLAPGYETFEAAQMGEYGYGLYPNVITSLEFERILSASGPFQGHVKRPSDGMEPKRIAFIQCVGSRNPARGINYCSAVCCMYATKEAIIAKEHIPNLQATIFFIDVRTFGKGFHRYYERAKNEYSVRYIKSMVSSVKEMQRTGNLLLKYAANDGAIRGEEFDLVVLSVGIRPPKDAAILAEKLSIRLNRHGFCETNPFSPVETSRPGVYVCGTFAGPKDIPETVVDASAAADQVGQLLASVRGTLIREQKITEERITDGEEPRIGVFICHCGNNIAGVVDVRRVVEAARALPYVVVAEDVLYACAPDIQTVIKQKIKEHNLNRIFVASCSPRTHEPLFQQTLQEAGLNKYLFEMANIRDQCSWVHMHEPELATVKAKDLVTMGLSRARYLEPLHSSWVDVNHRALVIGGGLSGMTAALSIARQGFAVDLIEKESELGGNLRELYYTLEGMDVQTHLSTLIQEVQKHPLIQVYTDAEIKEVKGHRGAFQTAVATSREPRDEHVLEQGAIVVATGAREFQTESYLYGKDNRVLTQRELEKKIVEDDKAIGEIKRLVMIQCVDSRDEKRPYCSRYCCSQAIKNALNLKEKNPDVDIFILYRDIKTYGFKEEYYQKAREANVKFVRYSPDNLPEVKQVDEGLAVSVIDTTLNRGLRITPDLLVLSVPTVAREGNEHLAKAIKVPLDSNGFFMEAHMKLRPVDFSSDGVFLCGLAHSPKFIEESIVQAKAAAARAVTLLSQKRIESEAMVPVINLEKCIGCAVCETVCAYGGIVVNETEKGKYAQVVLAACKACGSCSAACPEHANVPGHFTDRQLIAQINAFAEAPRFSRNGFEPKILALLCNWCAYAGADLAGISRIQYQPNTRIIRVMCTGRIDPALVVDAFLRGIDGVMILGCHPGDCHYSVGNLFAEKRMAHLRRVLETVGFEPNRFRLDWVSASEGLRFSKIVDGFTERVRRLGPIVG